MEKSLFLAILLLAAGALVSCERNNQEAEATLKLTDARVLLAAGEYEAARSAIMEIRREYPRALKVRRQAILVLDSIEMLAATDSIAIAQCIEDAEEYALRAEFYKKKIQHDAQANQE